MEVPFKTANPSQFKLRLVWGLETGRKLVAEFADCNWLPSKGDIMILPIDESLSRKTWHQYKVANVIYDFEHQVTRIVCAALIPQKFAEIEQKSEARLVKPEEAISPYLHGDCDELDEIVDDELNQLKKRLDAL